MRPKMFDFDPADVDADGICASQTPLAGGALTINGALAASGAVTLDYARQLCIVAAADESARTFTVTGTDADGKEQTEAITGPNATTGESTKYFKTISSITVDDATAGAVTVGTVDELASQTIPVDWCSNSPVAISVDVTGTMNFTVQQTFGPIQSPSTRKPQQDNAWHDISALASKTADTASVGTAGATGIRLLFNSYSSGAEAQVYVSQPVRA